MKDVEFNIDAHCLKSFHALKRALIYAPIMQHLDLNIPFEIMFDASDYAIKLVLDIRRTKRCTPSNMQAELWVKLI